MLQASPVDGIRAFFEGVDSFGGQIGVTVAALAAIWVLGWLLLPRAASRIRGSSIQWAVSGAVLRAVQFALVVGAGVALLYTWGYGTVVESPGNYLEEDLVFAGRVVGSLLIAFGSYAAARFLADAVTKLGSRADWMTEHQEEIVLRTSQLLLFGFVGLVILGLWDVNLGGLLVGAGFLGIVVGFAARQTLGSLIAGFVLMFSRPFTIGDWVEVGDQEGIVTDITIFNTRLENFDGEFVVIPNDRVSDRAITNRSQKGMLRLKVDVGVDDASDVERAQDVALDAISECTEVVDAPAPQVIPKSFGDSAIVLETRFWIDHPTPPRKWRAISAVVRSVKTAFEEEGIKIPYPQRELSGRAETGGFRVHEGEAVSDTADPRPTEQD
jgi:small-conductance mechanosensitive channel